MVIIKNIQNKYLTFTLDLTNYCNWWLICPSRTA
jgi:hypothetical protein